jgi:hypothetical protein
MPGCPDGMAGWGCGGAYRVPWDSGGNVAA